MLFAAAAQHVEAIRAARVDPAHRPPRRRGRHSAVHVYGHTSDLGDDEQSTHHSCFAMVQMKEVKEGMGEPPKMIAMAEDRYVVSCPLSISRDR